MPPKNEFFIPLGPDDEIRVRITTDRSQVLHFTVQQETLWEGRIVPVVRYDTAHGQAHIDVMDVQGRKIEKVELGYVRPFNQALQWCLNDARLNWKSRKLAFLKHEDKT